MQDLGLRLLERQDNIRRNDGVVDALRRVIVASGERTFEEVFPEYFPKTPVATESLPDDAYFGDEEEGGAFDYSKADLDMEAAEREILLLAGGLSDDMVTVSGDKPLNPGEWV